MPGPICNLLVVKLLDFSVNNQMKLLVTIPSYFANANINQLLTIHVAVRLIKE